MFKELGADRVKQRLLRLLVFQGVQVPQFAPQHDARQTGVAVLLLCAAQHLICQRWATPRVKEAHALNLRGGVEQPQRQAMTNSEVGILGEEFWCATAVLAKKGAGMFWGKTKVG